MAQSDITTPSPHRLPTSHPTAKTQVVEWLGSHGLSQLEGFLDKAGYEDVIDLKNLADDDEEFSRIVTAPGHRAKIKRLLGVRKLPPGELILPFVNSARFSPCRNREQQQQQKNPQNQQFFQPVSTSSKTNAIETPRDRANSRLTHGVRTPCLTETGSVSRVGSPARSVPYQKIDLSDVIFNESEDEVLIDASSEKGDEGDDDLNLNGDGPPPPPSSLRRPAQVQVFGVDKMVQVSPMSIVTQPPSIVSSPSPSQRYHSARPDLRGRSRHSSLSPNRKILLPDRATKSPGRAPSVKRSGNDLTRSEVGELCDAGVPIKITDKEAVFLLSEDHVTLSLPPFPFSYATSSLASLLILSSRLTCTMYFTGSDPVTFNCFTKRHLDLVAKVFTLLTKGIPPTYLRNL
eukprot:TRINITY_DN19143_c0_g1_i1.p1 TRINITY_DN19143_c0_g1~~TRINITY_DN19143_c0_g1_i1.p1  ORF type:complete len:410 (+),score=13.37 TRINITY_DN19143_c0_g1_i1:23-1231(+)